MKDDKLLKTGIIGTVTMAICCFTPVLVIAMGAAGLGAYVSGLDWVLFPLMGLSLCLIVVALIKRQKRKAAA